MYGVLAGAFEGDRLSMYRNCDACVDVWIEQVLCSSCSLVHRWMRRLARPTVRTCRGTHNSDEIFGYPSLLDSIEAEIRESQIVP